MKLNLDDLTFRENDYGTVVAIDKDGNQYIPSWTIGGKLKPVHFVLGYDWTGSDKAAFLKEIKESKRLAAIPVGTVFTDHTGKKIKKYEDRLECVSW